MRWPLRSGFHMFEWLFPFISAWATDLTKSLPIPAVLGPAIRYREPLSSLVLVSVDSSFGHFAQTTNVRPASTSNVNDGLCILLEPAHLLLLRLRTGLRGFEYTVHFAFPLIY
jgi:hypothetical protein